MEICYGIRMNENQQHGDIHYWGLYHAGILENLFLHIAVTRCNVIQKQDMLINIDKSRNPWRYDGGKGSDEFYSGFLR